MTFIPLDERSIITTKDERSIMTIKEVEKRTGLTAKTIRYYEKEGLLQVKRDKNNSYRNYSEDDVLLLKKIKLFRYLEFRVSEIKDILKMCDVEISALLSIHVETLQERSEKLQTKEDLCISLSKDLRKGSMDPDGYGEILEFCEDEEVQSIINELSAPSIPELIITIIIYLGPVLWLFIYIVDKRWDMLPLTAAIALIATVILTLSCKSYWDWQKNRRIALKRKNEKDKNAMKKVLPGILLGLVLVVILVIGLTHLFETLIAPEGWIFYEGQSPDIFIALLPIIAILFFAYLINGLLHHEKINIKLAVLGLFILFASTYLCFSNTVFVTDNSIVCCSPSNPHGSAYDYEDVTAVRARFGTRNFALHEYDKKSSFQYTIILGGEKYVFSVPSVNSDIERYQEDTYLELEDFDSALMALNIPKKSSNTGSEYCDLDARYRDRFLRIIQSSGSHQ